MVFIMSQTQNNEKLIPTNFRLLYTKPVSIARRLGAKSITFQYEL